MNKDQASQIISIGERIAAAIERQSSALQRISEALESRVEFERLSRTHEAFLREEEMVSYIVSKLNQLSTERNLDLSFYSSRANGRPAVMVKKHREVTQPDLVMFSTGENKFRVSRRRGKSSQFDSDHDWDLSMAMTVAIAVWIEGGAK